MNLSGVRPLAIGITGGDCARHGGTEDGIVAGGIRIRAHVDDLMTGVMKPQSQGFLELEAGVVTADDDPHVPSRFLRDRI